MTSFSTEDITFFMVSTFLFVHFNLFGVHFVRSLRACHILPLSPFRTKGGSGVVGQVFEFFDLDFLLNNNIFEQNVHIFWMAIGFNCSSLSLPIISNPSKIYVYITHCNHNWWKTLINRNVQRCMILGHCSPAQGRNSQKGKGGEKCYKGSQEKRHTW